jgi:hypothetical protein
MTPLMSDPNTTILPDTVGVATGNFHARLMFVSKAINIPLV